MMQLLCNGIALDLYDDASLQFTHDNPLFSFDNLKCERTTQFKLPSTPKNDQIFALARIPAYSGVGMRRKFSAQLQASAVVKNGYLYISSFDGKDYAAVFVTGEFVGLQAIKDAGSVRDILQYNSSITWNTANIKDANANNINDFDLVRYAVSDGAVVAPSVRVKKIIEDALEELGGSINWANATGYDKLRIFNASDLGLDDAEVHLINDPDESQDPINLSPFLGITQFALSGAYCYYNCEAVRDESGYYWRTRSQASPDHFYMWKIPFDCAIEFPRDFPSNYYLATGFRAWSESYDGWYEQPDYIRIDFLGGYSFSWGGTPIGEPLAGRTINIPANTPFALITPDGIKYQTPHSGDTGATIGFDPALVPAYDFKVKIKIDHDFASGDIVPYNAILPDITLVELLKIVAAVTGTMLNYENGTIKFETLAQWSQVEAKTLTKRGEVKRTFADYAQSNIVTFEHGDSVRSTEELETKYTIDNDNIETSKELQVLKCSEGGFDLYTYTSGDLSEQLERVKIRGEDKSATIARIDTRDTYMLRVSLPKNAGLQQLCDMSTQFKMSARMTLLEYNRIGSKYTLLVDGTQYVWTNRSWQKDEAQFTLAKRQ